MNSSDDQGHSFCSQLSNCSSEIFLGSRNAFNIDPRRLKNAVFEALDETNQKCYKRTKDFHFWDRMDLNKTVP